MKSTHFSLQSLLAISVLVLFLSGGCSRSPANDQFTHLWSSNGTHVWTHLGVELVEAESKVFTPPEYFLNRELLSEEKVKLVGGVVVRCEGDSLFINDRKIDQKNVLIENDGRIIANAYIKVN